MLKGGIISPGFYYIAWNSKLAHLEPTEYPWNKYPV